jgi:eukaryotic-like serine/threonine-protein kinase
MEMDSPRWQEVKRALNEVLELPADQRPSYLHSLVTKDAALFHEVESLLAADDQARSSFLEAPLAVRLGRGTRLGDYEIQSMLGAGGMGEVYRGRDTRLKRDVAIKVLPAFFSSDPDRLRRFEQEAAAAAALNHPNILSVYQLGTYEGTPYLVSELLEGETLREQIKRGPMPVRRALDYAVQIAKGLTAAHEKGIIHRDLKPENLFVTKDGRAKILDFGLVKLSRPEGGSDHSAPTLSGRTEPGAIMGTVGYMSPEQVKGQSADHRSDIFAFGAILHEMFTGKRAFQKATAAETMAVILNEDPPSIAALQAGVPSAVDRLVRACVAKDPECRWRDAYDLSLALDWIAAEASPAASSSGLQSEAGVRLVQACILPPEKSAFLFSGPNAGPVVVSPDGCRVVFTARHSDSTLLFVRRIDSAVAEPLGGTAGAIFPFWSPDSRSLGFFADGNLRRIEASGGPPQTLCPAPAGRGGSWNRDGTIIFTPTPTDPIYRLPATGGSPHRVTTLDPAHITTHRWPCFLPDGNHFLYFGGHPLLNGGIYVGCLDGSEHKLVLQGYLNAAYAPPGFLLFVRDGTLVARRFDAQQFETTGDDFPIAEMVMADPFVQRALFSVSENGVLVYHHGGVAEHPRLIWFNRNGRPGSPLRDPSVYVWHRLSPEGRKLAGTDRLGGRSNIWILDLGRGVRTRLTFDPSTNIRPIWSPNGSRIIFSSNRKGSFHIYQKAANGAGEDELLLDSGADEQAESWSPEGKYLAYLRRDPGQQTAADIWILPLSARGKPFPCVQGEFDKSFPAFSPDGRWIAYASNESGRFEIYVAPFPGAKGKWQISSSGGTFPRWRGDGKELFYLGPDNRIRATEITARGNSARVGSGHVVFRVQTVPTPISPFDVSPDGLRFLINTMPTPQDDSEPFTLLINWTKRLSGASPSRST